MGSGDKKGAASFRSFKFPESLDLLSALNFHVHEAFEAEISRWSLDISGWWNAMERHGHHGLSRWLTMSDRESHLEAVQSEADPYADTKVAEDRSEIRPIVERWDG